MKKIHFDIPTIEFSQDDGNTWEIWCFFNNQNLEEALVRRCETITRLRGHYRDWKFRIATGVATLTVKQAPAESKANAAADRPAYPNGRWT